MTYYGHLCGLVGNRVVLLGLTSTEGQKLNGSKGRIQGIDPWSAENAENKCIRLHVQLNSVPTRVVRVRAENIINQTQAGQLAAAGLQLKKKTGGAELSLEMIVEYSARALAIFGAPRRDCRPDMRARIALLQEVVDTRAVPAALKSMRCCDATVGGVVDLSSHPLLTQLDLCKPGCVGDNFLHLEKLCYGLVGHGDDTDPCAICLDEKKLLQELTMLPCGHSFHPTCIHNVLEKSPVVCPICRFCLNPKATVSNCQTHPKHPTTARILVRFTEFLHSGFCASCQMTNIESQQLYNEVVDLPDGAVEVPVVGGVRSDFGAFIRPNK